MCPAHSLADLRVIHYQSSDSHDGMADLVDSLVPPLLWPYVSSVVEINI